MSCNLVAPCRISVAAVARTALVMQLLVMATDGFQLPRFYFSSSASVTPALFPSCRTASHACKPNTANSKLFMSSFAADGSEYSSKDSDYDDDEIENMNQFSSGVDDTEAVAETVELGH